MNELEENVVYQRLPGCPNNRVTTFYRYTDGVLQCRSSIDRSWTRSIFRMEQVAPWLDNVIPAHLRVSEGL